MENESLESRLNQIEAILNRVLHHFESENITNSNNDQWLNLAEVCEYMPNKPAKSTIYALVRKRRIPFHKPDKNLIFSKREIDEYIKSGRRKTLTENRAEAYLSLKKRKQ
ncbi:MAG: helix-turn-helix domain-containing protein [Bacteroidetes bacterium]|nr:helix-turn-helix domain-containing protein [Bacteroidota bacterium]